MNTSGKRTAADQRYDDVIATLRLAFEQACADIPLLQRHIAVFFNNMTPNSDLRDIATLAFDIGVDIQVRLVARTASTQDAPPLEPKP